MRVWTWKVKGMFGVATAIAGFSAFGVALAEDRWPAASYPRTEFFKNEKEIELVLILPSRDPYFAALYRGAVEQAAKWSEHGAKISVAFEHTSTFSNAAETQVLNAAVARGVDAVLVIPTSDGMAQPFRAAMEKGTGIIILDTPLTDSRAVVAQIFSDNYGGGVEAGKLLCKAVDGKGAVFQESLRPGLNAPDLRIKGVQDALAEHCPEVANLDAQYNNFDPSRARAQTAAMLQAHPDLTGIFTATDGDYKGVVAALKEAGKAGEVKVVGYDLDPAQVPLLKEGTFSALVAQQPAAMSAIGVDYAVEWLNGRREFDTPIIVPQVVVTKDNVDSLGGLQYTGP